MDEENPVHSCANPAVADYGTWDSPISAAAIVARGVRLFQPQLDGGRAYWLETRPQEEGRTVLVGETADGGTVDLSPQNYSVRSRVHEYGGGAYRVRGDDIWFVENADQAIYHLRAGRAPRRLTADSEHRHADLERDERRGRLLCVCEDHGGDGEPTNFIAAVDDLGSKTVLVEGRDFYSSPRISRAGDRLAWISWCHPNLPWDGTELWLAELDPDGAVVAPRCVAGGPDESVCQPAWGPDGRLYFVSDRSDWWNLYVYDNGAVRPVASLAAETAWPQWVFGQSAYAFDDAGGAHFAATANGHWQLFSARLDGGDPAPVPCPWNHIEHLVGDAERLLLIAGGPDQAASLVELRDGRPRTLVASSETTVPAGCLSRPESVSFRTGGGEEAHGLFYPPVNEAWRGAPSERPPLLIKCHGGPTGATSTAQDLRTQFWTSRGFAVLDVNYRGSTGYGRAYRRSLYGRWGVADVEDCVAGARALAEAGRIDGERLLISGGSAGGYTVLCALTFTDAFRAGGSHYGIGDLESMFETTHKFEARYDHSLLGEGAAERGLFRSRSPLHHADRITCPVIFFQGARDRVVPPEQSQTMVAALRARGLPVAYLEYPDEAHGFRRAESVQESLEAELYFFCRALGLPPPAGVRPVPIENAAALD
jgi:dipeptidyl aminopeptidase/acylaminoacyl peptidase